MNVCLVNYKLRICYWLIHNIPHNHRILWRKWHLSHSVDESIKVQEDECYFILFTHKSVLKACHTHLGWCAGDTVNTVPKSLSAQTCSMVSNIYLHIWKHSMEEKYQLCLVLKHNSTILNQKAEDGDKND